MSDEFKAWLREICERHRDALEEIGWTEKKAKPPYVPVEMRTLVEVLRCEECKHRGSTHLNWGQGNVEYVTCKMMVGRCHMTMVVSPDDYCSQGERGSDE